MKKTMIIICMTFMSVISHAQLKVDSIGRVNIGVSSYSHPALYVGSSSQGINSNSGIEVDLSSSWHSSTKYGLRSSVTDSFATSGAKEHALWSYASGSSAAQSFGLTTGIDAVNGAAIYACCRWPYAPYITGTYAGYFDGSVYVSGTITGTLVSESDRELKENICEMGDAENTALDNINRLSPVSYNYKVRENRKPVLTEEDIKDMKAHGVDPKKYLQQDCDPVSEKTHFGLIAQELQEVYPELVYKQQDGYLAINYTELIPVLMQAIKDLNGKVEKLSELRSAKARVAAQNEVENTSAVDGTELTGGLLAPSMSQNIPNPFSERTDIAITLPESTQKAVLYIYDMTGKQLEQHEVTGRGQTTMTIYADRMSNGMYIYALLADGNVITSKKMIVAK